VQTCGSRQAPRPPRKASSQRYIRPYRKPTQVGWQKTAKVNERPSVKELGKLTPYLRKKGGLSRGRSCIVLEKAARNRLNRLFTKNTGLCEHESGSIGADSCPVPEG
jgi:hypothetical protein